MVFGQEIAEGVVPTWAVEVVEWIKMSPLFPTEDFDHLAPEIVLPPHVSPTCDVVMVEVKVVVPDLDFSFPSVEEEVLAFPVAATNEVAVEEAGPDH